VITIQEYDTEKEDRKNENRKAWQQSVLFKIASPLGFVAVSILQFMWIAAMAINIKSLREGGLMD